MALSEHGDNDFQKNGDHLVAELAGGKHQRDNRLNANKRWRASRKYGEL